MVKEKYMENSVLTKCEKIVIFFLSLWVFLVFRNKINVIDNVVYLFLHSFESDSLTSFIKIITYLGSAYILIPLAFLSLFFIKKDSNNRFISINLVLSFLLNQMLKRVFRRTRPLFTHLVKEGGFSFPSGHAMVSFCFYGFIIYLIYKSNLKHKKIYELLLSLLIVIIGLTRIYLGVHFFSDIVAGFGFGLLYLLIFIRKIKLK